MQTITKQEAANLIRNTNGKVFNVEFVKANGELRKMTARTKVTKWLKGSTSTIADKPHLIGCYDMQAGKREKGKGYRCINVETLKSLKAGGKEYTVV